MRSLKDDGQIHPPDPPLLRGGKRRSPSPRALRSLPPLRAAAGTEADTDSNDLQIVSDLFRRTALNLKSALAFARTTAFPVADTAQAILSGSQEWRGYPAQPGPTAGVQIHPPTRLTLFNGSPRGAKGNTPIMLHQFSQGFQSAGEEVEMFHLNRLSEREQHLAAFAAAECVWLGFPLYTDAMPGIVKAFIDDLEPFKGRAE